MTTVKELVQSQDSEQVIAAISLLYPKTTFGSLIGYRKVLDWLLVAEPVANELKCELYRSMSDDDEPVPYVSVHGRDGENGWSIEYMPWPEWLGMEVVVKPEVGDLPDAHVLAHILAEMTWAGFDNATIQGKLERIVSKVSRG